MTHRLVVWLGDRRVGTLADTRIPHRPGGGGLVFTYDPDWLDDPAAVPLSTSLPLGPDPFPEAASRAFFANVLPEGRVRAVLARLLGTSEGNDFALLEAIGGECAGAVRLVPEDAVGTARRGDYRTLDDAALDEILAGLGRHPFLAGRDEVRLSLAGAQDKLPLYRDGDRWCLPVGDAPSSHILKPPIPDYPGTVVNEALCMGLATVAGLPAPRVSLRAGRVPCFVVERFDRVRTPDGRLERLHQEDFCQALGFEPERKYEHEGGPRLQDCFRLVADRSVRPAADRLALLDWTGFVLLTGNADAHAKNLALLHRPDGAVLAPFYDLLSTAPYPDLSDRLAMGVGGERRPRWIAARHWSRLGDEVGFRPRLVARRLRDLAERLPDLAAGARDRFEATHGWVLSPDERRVLDAVLGTVRARARLLPGRLPDGP